MGPSPRRRRYPVARRRSQPARRYRGRQATPCQERRRWAASSTKPAPEEARVTYLGSAVMRPAYLRTLATPTELGKPANIEASLGESPTKSADAGFAAGSRSKCRASRAHDVIRLS